MSRIDGVRLKIERAKKHLNDLEDRVRVFAESEPYVIEARPHPVAAIEHTALYIKSVELPPNDIPLMIGDVLHNLRSSLDHLAWQLVEAGGGTPDKDTYFPVSETLLKFQSAAGKIKRVDTNAMALIRDSQRYVTNDDTLWNIHELDIVDKHRLLITVALGLGAWGVNIFAIRQTIWFHESELFQLVPGQEIVNIPTSTYEKQKPKDFKLGIDIAFGEPALYKGRSVIATLKQMTTFVEDFVSKFERFLI